MQVLEIITDACILEPNIGIGAAICRSNSPNDTQGESRMSQILRGCWIFNASQSFEAELLTGILSITECLKIVELQTPTPNFFMLKLNISYYCDLPYLNSLFENKDSGSNITLKDLVQRIVTLTQSSTLAIKYPTTSREKKYHQYCHRICSELRGYLKSKDLKTNSPSELVQAALRKYPKWTLIE